ncbi:MAG: ParB/RepB/Spo0J family partition protein [Bdellovibrionales bacterium]|nr:ParB/RepB/Spo0J family partition protein [Bdellovibrionales bacterium]
MSEEVSVPLRKVPKKGLGRGIGSLLGELSAANEETELKRVETVKKSEQAAAPTPANNITIPPGASVVSEQKLNVPAEDRVWKIAIEKLVPNKEQPRKTFNPGKLSELAASIKEKGVLLPILVRPIAEGKFEIIAGERRWRASQLAGAQDVPVIIRKTENVEALELALIENVQRQDINPIEEAEAYSILSTKYGLTQQQIAEKVSKDRSTIANLLRLMSLTAEVKAMMKTGELPLGQAKVLLAVEEPSAQVMLAKKALKQNLSVRAVEKLVAKYKSGDASAVELEDQEISRRDIAPLISELQRLLGTKVSIDTAGQRSKVSIQFYSTPELNQFIERLRKSAK